MSDVVYVRKKNFIEGKTECVYCPRSGMRYDFYENKPVAIYTRFKRDIEMFKEDKVNYDVTESKTEQVIEDVVEKVKEVVKKKK